MESNTAQFAGATNACSNCGGTLEYDFTINANKCLYCGSVFKINQQPAANADSQAPDAGCIRFKNNFDGFKGAVILFLTSGKQTPVNLLFDASFLQVEQLYIPFYQFTGNYDGYYNSLDKHGKVVAQNTPLNGEYAVTAYGGYDEAEGKNVMDFAIAADKKLIAPITSTGTDDVYLTDNAPEAAAWENFGKLQAAAKVYRTLNEADAGHQHNHYLKYHAKNTSMFYYPVWRTTYIYMGKSYNIYMDDVSGELMADRPVDMGLCPPTRGATFKKNALVGLGIWFGMLVLRAALTAIAGSKFDIYATHPMNNIAFSNPLSLYWYLRGMVFLVIFPTLMATVFYPWAMNRYYSKLQNFRQRNQDLVASGRKNIAFNLDH